MTRRTKLETRTPARRAGLVKITRADGTVEYEEPLSPGEMGKLATAESEKDSKAAERIVGAKRKKVSPFGVRLETRSEKGLM